jgi:hypothetical protein
LQQSAFPEIQSNDTAEATIQLLVCLVLKSNKEGKKNNRVTKSCRDTPKGFGQVLLVLKILDQPIDTRIAIIPCQPIPTMSFPIIDDRTPMPRAVGILEAFLPSHWTTLLYS